MTYKAEAPSKASDQLGFRPKRFWREAAVVEAGGGYAVALDGRRVKTPMGSDLALPTSQLAQRVADEWQAVGDRVAYENMHLTRLGFAAIDRMGAVQDDMLTEVTRYAETDLLCYPSDYPQALMAREDAAWRPLLDWADEVLGLKFEPNRTLVHKPQPAETLTRLRQIVREATAYEQAGLMLAIPLFGSVVLALALWRGRLGGAEALSLSRIGEDFQSETWGADTEAAQRRDAMTAEAVGLETWFKALA